MFMVSRDTEDGASLKRSVWRLTVQMRENYPLVCQRLHRLGEAFQTRRIPVAIVNVLARVRRQGLCNFLGDA